MSFDYFLETEEIRNEEANYEEFNWEIAVDASWGIYIPQRFCESYEKPDNISEEDWAICLKGPEHEWYWEAWDEIRMNYKVEFNGKILTLDYGGYDDLMFRIEFLPTESF